MTANQIKTMNCDECFNEINRIEGKARMAGKDLTEAQKKTIKALEKRINDQIDHFCED